MRKNSKIPKLIVGIAIIVSILLCVKLLYSDPQESLLSEGETTAQDYQHYTAKVVTDNLILYYPDYTSIDLVCGTMPSIKDKRVIFCAEAAFTGELLKEFKHSNILGDHVSGGVRYKGSGCKRNTGAFIYYDQHWQFLHKDYSKKLDVAARNGGMGFGQE